MTNNKRVKTKLFGIAKKARAKCERVNNKHDLFPDTLDGMCGIASAYLFKELKKHKLNPTLAENSSHCFILCKGYIVDITASQFGYRRVVVEEIEDLEGDGWWNTENTFKSLSKFNTHQKKSWPKFQRYKDVEHLLK